MRFVNPGTVAQAVASIGLAPIQRDVIRQKPIPNNANDAADALFDAQEELIRSKGGIPANIEDNQQVPPDTLKGKFEAAMDTDKYARAARLPNGDYRVTYNPNADRALLAHELGHVTSQQTKLGRAISDARHAPALQNALTKAAFLTVPAGAVAALTQGDDDYTASAALALAASAPTIADEVLATNYGLSIMNRADLAPTLGGRAKLAGGLLSYMAAPLAMAGAANFVGNLMDDELVGQQTSGTVQM